VDPAKAGREKAIQVMMQSSKVMRVVHLFMVSLLSGAYMMLA
jgi:hypothetical protein